MDGKRKLSLAMAFYERCSALFCIDRKEGKYQSLKMDDVLNRVIDETGSLTELFAILFNSNKDDVDIRGGHYSIFIDERLFEKDNYSGHLKLTVQGVNAGYYYSSIRLNDTESMLILLRNDEQDIIEQNERIKVETLREGYLFSMMVDLNEDSCKNANITEISTNNQSFLDMTYSQWRKQIVNMFLPNDQSTFLKISDPDYVIGQLLQKQQYRYEIKMMNMRGEYIWSRLVFRRMKNFTKETPVFIYMVEDINEEMTRLLEQENIIAAIEEKNKRLVDINKAKTLFISNMSHEIRTPINAVLGLDEMILRTSQDEKILSYARDIKNAGKMLLSIINDILDYSKIESGKMQIVPTEYNVAEMISNISAMIMVKAKEKELPVHVHVSKSIPSVLLGDELRIRQIIVNLLTNAVKYTEHGSISFSVEYEEHEKQEIALKVSVKDTGIGIKEEDMKNLFEEYARLDEKRNHNIEGTGLGMGIVVRLLEQMNSKLEVESVYGEGSTFSFILIQRVVDETPIGNFNTVENKEKDTKNEQNVLKISKARILVVDDNRINLMVVEGLLKRTEAKVQCASSGQECLNWLKHNPVDLVLLDHLMPEMNGLETLKKIREMGAQFEKLPVVVLTANVVSGAKEQYMNAGFSDYLEKPVSAKLLEDMLRKYLPEGLR